MLHHPVRPVDPASVAQGSCREITTPTLVRVVTPPVGQREGHPFALAAQVVTVREQTSTPSGSVAFRVGDRVLGIAPVDASGTAILTDVVLSSGVHGVVASYGGDSHHAAASSAPMPMPVSPAALPVAVVLAAPRCVPDGVLLEATLLHAQTGRRVEPPWGQLTFCVDGVPVATAPLGAGMSSTVLDVLPPGRVSARFCGDQEHAAAEGFYAP